MTEFQGDRFIQMLHELPPREPLGHPAKHSKYLQKHVFQPLKAGKTVHLSKLDWSAFGMDETTPSGYWEQYNNICMGWSRGLAYRFQKIVSLPCNTRTFF